MKTVATLGLAVSLLVGCGGPDFDEQREKWRAQEFEEYVIRICGSHFSGGCGVFGVSGDTVVASAISHSVDWIMDEHPEQGDPVEALFDRAEAASDDCDFDVAFNWKYGYVRTYDQICERTTRSERVTCFYPYRSDLADCMQ